MWFQGAKLSSYLKEGVFAPQIRIYKYIYSNFKDIYVT